MCLLDRVNIWFYILQKHLNITVLHRGTLELLVLDMKYFQNIQTFDYWIIMSGEHCMNFSLHPDTSALSMHYKYTNTHTHTHTHTYIYIHALFTISLFQKEILGPLNPIIIQVASYKYVGSLTLTQASTLCRILKTY